MTDFTLSATVRQPYGPTVERVRGLLAQAGFGVLTEIDIRATLAAKLGIEIPPQVILGACRPELAHQALQADPRIATMLPCNVVVAAVDAQTTRVEILDPEAMTSFSDAPELVPVAAAARERLAGMIEAIATEGGGVDAPAA